MDPLLSAYRLRLETGDLDYGSFDLAMYLQSYWYVRLPRDPFL